MKHARPDGLWRSGIVLLALVAAPMQAQATESFTCKVRDVTVFSNRIHVRCTTATVSGIYFFALPTSDSVQANRLLTIGSTTLVSGRKFIATFYPDATTGAAWGCQTNDCRPLVAFGIQ
jgi:hypothetical protein